MTDLGDALRDYSWGVNLFGPNGSVALQRIPPDLVVEHHMHVFEVSAINPNILRCTHVYRDGVGCFERRVPIGSQLPSWTFRAYREELSPGWQQGKPSYHIPPKEIGPDECPPECPEHPGSEGKRRQKEEPDAL